MTAWAALSLQRTLFRATQAEEKLRREAVTGKAAANATHHEVGERVRQTIADIGGTMPEDLPTPDRSVKELECEQRRLDGGDE